MRQFFVRTLCLCVAVGLFSSGVDRAANAQSEGIGYRFPKTMEAEYCYRVLCDHQDRLSIAEGCQPLSELPTTPIAGGLKCEWNHYRQTELNVPVVDCVGGDLFAESEISGGSSLQGNRSSISFSLEDSVRYFCG